MQRKLNIYYSIFILNKLVPIHVALIKFSHSLGPLIEGIIIFACAKGKNYKQSCHVSLKSELKICRNLLLARLTHVPVVVQRIRLLLQQKKIPLFPFTLWQPLNSIQPK
jgi:hypothetical protein